MNVTVTLAEDHRFQDQARRPYHFASGTTLTGELRLAASDWPIGLLENGLPTSLAVEFVFAVGAGRLAYKAVIGSRRLWPRTGAEVQIPEGVADGSVGPIGGMRDDREDFSYILPGGVERRFRLKYVGFQCWVSTHADFLEITLRHFCPNTPPDDYSTIRYALAIEAVLFLPEVRLSYDKDGFIEDYAASSYVRIEDAVSPQGSLGASESGLG